MHLSVFFRPQSRLLVTSDEAITDPGRFSLGPSLAWGHEGILMFCLSHSKRVNYLKRLIFWVW